jgi:preprotein translocase subunit SecF
MCIREEGRMMQSVFGAMNNLLADMLHRTGKASVANLFTMISAVGRGTSTSFSNALAFLLVSGSS